MRKSCTFCLLLLCSFFSGVSDKATAQLHNFKGHHSRLCDEAALAASKAVGVPLNTLKAIARVESGRTVAERYVPWPWTVNVEGVGAYFNSKADALAHIDAHNKRGYTSIDAGCFQVNLKWHGHNFKSIEDALNPEINAKYAAGFLRDLYLEFGDWDAAAGAYHSRNREFSALYLEKYRAMLVRMNGSNFRGTLGPMNRELNRFPLLQGQSNSPSRGSLFPESSEPKQGFFAPIKSRG